MEKHVVTGNILTIHHPVILDVLRLHHLQPLRVVETELLRLDLLRPRLIKFLQTSTSIPVTLRLTVSRAAPW